LLKEILARVKEDFNLEISSIQRRKKQVGNNRYGPYRVMDNVVRVEQIVQGTYIHASHGTYIHASQAVQGVDTRNTGSTKRGYAGTTSPRSVYVQTKGYGTYIRVVQDRWGAYKAIQSTTEVLGSRSSCQVLL
jgi:hypothetical protein